MTAPTMPHAAIAHEAMARAALVRVIRDGQPPNGIAPADCGPWGHVVEAVHAAHAAGGTDAARAAFASMGKADRNVAALLAEDPPATDPADAWQPPIPLGDTRELPRFPVDALPPWLASCVAAEAEASQVPADLPGMLALAVLATACQGRVRVRVNAGWAEPVNLFALVSLPPGNRKSAVFSSMCAPLEAFERDEAERLAPEIARAASERRMIEAQLKAAETSAANPKKGDDAQAARADAQRLAVELAAHQVPAVPRLIADDVTPEMLASLLAEQSGRMAVLSAEGGIFDILSGRYSSGTPNLECFLKGHAGDTLRVDRRTRPPDYVPSPALTVGLCVQPEVLQGLVQRPTFRGRGLLGRFLYSVPESLLGRRRVDAPPVPASVRSAYTQRVTALAALAPATGPDGKPVAHALTLSPGAAARIRAFAEALEPRLGPWGDLADMTDWAGKLAGAVVRIAGLLHMADAGPAGLALPIADATMADAARLGAYLAAHARAAFASMGANEDLAAAQHVARWIERTGGASFTRRECFEGLKGTYKRADALDAPLAVLIEHGYIRRRPAPAKVGRPSEVYDVNPLAPSQNAQYSQNPAPVAYFANSANIANEDTPAEDTPPEGVPVARIIPRAVAIDPTRLPELLDRGMTRAEAVRVLADEDTHTPAPAAETPAQAAARRLADLKKARFV